METLTKKAELAIQYKLDGCNKTQAVRRAYECKDDHTASALADKLFKQPKVVKRLEEKQAMLDSVSIDKIVDFQTQLLDKIPYSKIVAKLNKLIDGKSGRESLEAIKEYNRILGNYKEKDVKSLGMFKDV